MTRLQCLVVFTYLDALGLVAPKRIYIIIIVYIIYLYKESIEKAKKAKQTQTLSNHDVPATPAMRSTSPALRTISTPLPNSPAAGFRMPRLIGDDLL